MFGEMMRSEKNRFACKRHTANLRVELSDDMRIAFNDVIDMFDGDVEKARRYLSDKYEEFSEKIEPFFNQFALEIDSEDGIVLV